MIENWLSRVNTQIIPSIVRKDKENFFNNIEVYTNKMPNLKKIDIAIVGIDPQISNDIRRSLYALKYNFVNINLIDLGNVKKNNTNFIIPLLKELLENDVFPLIIGESSNIFYAMYQAYQSKSHQINAGIISNHLGDENNIQDFNLNDFISQEDNHLFTLSGIGIQSHLLSHKTMLSFRNKKFSILNLGIIKENMLKAEPLLRDLDVLAFDVSVCKSNFAPASTNLSPNGLNEHEACVLSMYAGLSDKLTSFCLIGLNPFKDINNQTTTLSSQIIWYFLEGFNQRVGDFPISISNLEKHSILDSKNEIKYNFLMSNKTGRWWIEMPWADKNEFKRHYLIPCGNEEYNNAKNGIEPPSITHSQAKFQLNLK